MKSTPPGSKVSWVAQCVAPFASADTGIGRTSICPLGGSGRQAWTCRGSIRSRSECCLWATRNMLRVTSDPRPGMLRFESFERLTDISHISVRQVSEPFIGSSALRLVAYSSIVPRHVTVLSEGTRRAPSVLGNMRTSSLGEICRQRPAQLLIVQLSGHLFVLDIVLVQAPPRRHAHQQQEHTKGQCSGQCSGL